MPNGIEKGYGPLHSAANLGEVARAKELLKSGEDVNAKAGNGDTPLHAGLTAPLGERYEMVKLLISEGANVNAEDGIGMTPLGWVLATMQRVNQDQEDLLQVLRALEDLLRERGALEPVPPGKQ